MIYFDLEPAIKMLDDSQCGRLFRAIMQYAHHGEAPEFEEAVMAMAWSFVKTAVDRDNGRYQRVVKGKKIAGITSDFKRNYAPKHGIDPEDKEALDEYISQRLSTDVD